MSYDPNMPVPESMAMTQATTTEMGGFGSVDDNLQRRIGLITKAAPLFGYSGDGITAATQLAQSAMSDEELIKLAKSQAAISMTNSVREQLDQEKDDFRKWQMYNGLDPMQKKLLQQGGFVPPKEVQKEEDDSFLGTVKSVAGGALKTITGHGEARGLGDIAGMKEVVGLIPAGGRAVNRAYRAHHLITEEQGFWGWASSENRGLAVQNFMDAWDKVGDGEGTFTAKAMERVGDAIPEDDKYDFVQALAEGIDTYDYLTKEMGLDPADPLFQDTYLKYSQYVSDEKVRNAVVDLKNNTISPGRDVAGAVGLRRGTLPFKIMSGGLDATWTVVSDPTLILGKVSKTARLARFAVATNRLDEAGYLTARVDELAKMPRFSKAMDQIALRFQEGNIPQLFNEMPAMRRGVNSLSTYLNKAGIDYQNVTRDDVIGFFKSEAAKTDLLKGNFNVPHFPGTTIPMWTKGQQVRSGIADIARMTADKFRLADLGLDGMSLGELKAVYRAAGQSDKWATVAQAQAGIGEFLRSLITKAPGRDWINPLSDDAPLIFKQMMDYALPAEMQKGFMDDFLKGTTIEARRAAYNSAVDAMWHYSGAKGTDAGKDIFRQITQADQVYAQNGKDLLNGTPAGILEIDHATAWAIPTFKDMLKATSDITTARKYLDQTDDGLIGKFMNHWRPAVLLRVGFIPRAYGEELLSFISREGIKGLTKSYAARSAVKGDEMVLLKPVNWMADAFLDHIPLVGDHVQMFAKNTVKYADMYFKDFAERYAGKEYMRTARTFARYNALDAVARETGQVFGSVRQDLGERARRETIKAKNANGDIYTANVSFGQMTTHMRGDAFYHHTAYREMRRVADSELAKPILDAMRRRITMEEGDELVRILKEQGFLQELDPHIPMVKDVPRVEGLTREEFIAKLPKPKTMTSDNIIAVDPRLAEITPHQNIKAMHSGDETVYSYIDDEGNLLGQAHLVHPSEGVAPTFSLTIAPTVKDDYVEQALAATADSEMMTLMTDYAGFESTRYAKNKEFARTAVEAEIPGEPIPRTDLNYGHALLRARQSIPDAIMPKFEQYLKNSSFVSQNAVIKELVDNDMPEDLARALVDSLEFMSPRHRQALFTQDGSLERQLQARTLDPNAEFDMADVPGFTSDRYYHGTYTMPENGKLRPIHYEEGNLYGPGFYVTEDASVADEYTEKAWGAGGSAGEQRQGIWQLGWQGKKAPRLIDIDQNVDDVADEVKNIISAHYGDVEMEMGLTINDYLDGAVSNQKLGGILDALASKADPDTGVVFLSGSKAEAFINNLQEAGFDGYTHIGGRIMGSHEHKVSIFFDTSRLGVLKAPGYDKVPGFVPSVRQTIETQAKKDYERMLLELWSEGGSTMRIGEELARARLAQGDMSHYGQLMRRGQEVPGGQVAQRPAAGSRRVYTVMAPAEVLQGTATKELRFAPLGSIFDHEEGWVPIASGEWKKAQKAFQQVARLDDEAIAQYDLLDPQIVDYWATRATPQDLQVARIQQGKIVGEADVITPRSPEELAQFEQLIDDLVTRTRGLEVNYNGEMVMPDDMAWFTADHHEAVMLQQKMLQYKPGIQLHVGYTDIDEAVFRQGRDAAKTSGAGGLHPTAKASQSNQVWLPKEHRRDFQALGDDYQMLEPPVPTGHVRLYSGNDTDKLSTSTGDYNRVWAKKADAEARMPTGPSEHDLYEEAANRVRVASEELDAHQRLISRTDPEEPDYLDLIEQRERLRANYERLNSELPTRPEGEAPVPRGMHYVDVPRSKLDEFPAGGNAGDYYVPPDLMLQPLSTELAVGVDQMAAYRSWGAEVSRKVHDVFGGQGTFDENMATVVNNSVNDQLRLDDLWPLQSTQLPEQTLGPQIYMPEKDGFLKGVYRWGFDKVTQAGDALIRAPMVMHQYTKASPAVRAVVTQQLGDPKANHVIKLVSDHLGETTDNVVSAWYSLPEDIRAAVNPMEAARLRDPIPANLRLVEDHADLQKIADAAEAIYLHKDPQKLKELEAELIAKNQGIRGVLPSVVEDEAGSLPSLDELVDSYLSVPEKMRTNIYQNGMPEWFPEELMGREMPLNADQWSEFRAAIESNQYLEQTIHDITLQRAINDTLPWVDNHHVRSQFQEHAKNFIPFWFAQEQFLSRTANLIARDPTVIRKAQLGLHGLNSMGAITTNQYGEQVYDIPFTGALMKVLQKGASIFGKYSIPQIDPMTGQVKYTLPGLDQFSNIAPSFSPVASLPLQGISSLVPELKPVSDWVSGPRASTGPLSLEKMVKQIMPSYAYTIYQGFFEDPNADQQMLSTMIQTAQRLEAAGLGIPETEAGSLDMPAEKMQEYLDRLQNHTRLATIVKGVVGFFSPVAPSINPVEQLSPEFQKLLRTMPLDDALTSFMAAHPDGLPYTVLRTKVPSGAPLPSSQEVLDVLEQKPEFFTKYPNAGAWFLPQSTADESFVQDAYNQQMAMNLRVRKSIKDWYRDYYFAAASQDYFDTKGAYEDAYQAAKGDPTTRQMMEQKYKDWKEQYFAQHPVFAEEIQSPEGKQRRARILREMETALDDPEAPQSLHNKNMRDLIDTYNGYIAERERYNRNTQSDIQMKRYIKDQFDAWSYTYVFENPQVRAFYNRVIKPEVEGQ